MGRLLATIALLFSLECVSKTIHVAQVSSGSDDGSSASNAKSLAWANSATNWASGAGKISAGDSLVLNGVFTNSLLIGGSGTQENPITILFASESKFLAGSWPDPHGAIYIGSNDWITIDGGVNGSIQATNNGSSLGLQEDASGVRGDGVRGITVRSLTITNLYDRTVASDGNRYGYAIVLEDAKDVLVESNHLWGGDTMIAMTWAPGISSNWIIRGNTIGGCNHGMSLGTFETGSYLDGVAVTGNRIDNLSVWDGNSDLHLDGIILFVESPSYDGWVSNMVVSGNHIGSRVGITNTAALFINTYRHWQFAASRIVNNLFTIESPYNWTGGFVYVGSATNTLVANNTLQSYGQSGIGIAGATGSSMQLTNNLFYGVGAPISLGPASSIPVCFMSDRNLFWDFKSSGSEAFYTPGYSAGSLATWRAEGFDINSTTNQPILNASLVPLSSDTEARGKGVDLSAYFTDDFTGAARVAPWDIGAYEYSGTTATAGTVNVGTLIIAP